MKKFLSNLTGSGDKVGCCGVHDRIVLNPWTTEEGREGQWQRLPRSVLRLSRNVLRLPRGFVNGVGETPAAGDVPDSKLSTSARTATSRIHATGLSPGISATRLSTGIQYAASSTRLCTTTGSGLCTSWIRATCTTTTTRSAYAPSGPSLPAH